MEFAWKADPLAFRSLSQWQSTLVMGLPVTEYLTARQRQEPYRTLEVFSMEVGSAENAMVERDFGFLE